MSIRLVSYASLALLCGPKSSSEISVEIFVSYRWLLLLLVSCFSFMSRRWITLSISWLVWPGERRRIFLYTFVPPSLFPFGLLSLSIVLYPRITSPLSGKRLVELHQDFLPIRDLCFRQEYLSARPPGRNQLAFHSHRIA